LLNSPFVTGPDAKEREGKEKKKRGKGVFPIWTYARVPSPERRERRRERGGRRRSDYQLAIVLNATVPERGKRGKKEKRAARLSADPVT